MASNSEDQAEMVVDLTSPQSSVDDSSRDRNAVQEGTDFIASFPAFPLSSWSLTVCILLMWLKMDSGKVSPHVT